MDNAEGWFFRGGKGPDWEYITGDFAQTEKTTPQKLCDL